MTIWVYLRCVFILLLLTACANTERLVSATETPVPLGLSPTASPRSTADLPDSQIDISSLSGKILFSAEGDIFVINADGTGRTQITDHQAEQDRKSTRLNSSHLVRSYA